ncbi:cyclin d2 [Trifolium pratense]|uniref:Cyclin d2 n=1 Tax=Trifolium pratense TaxID=57577 RepID=A0A2K3KYB3_TRIPR|nr:cyclin d2 [Trifolium pratense]
MEKVYEDLWHPRFENQRNQQQRFGVVRDELPLQSEECLVLMLEKEFQQWPGADYLNRLQYGVLDFGARNEGSSSSTFWFRSSMEGLDNAIVGSVVSVYSLRPKRKTMVKQSVETAMQVEESKGQIQEEGNE